MRIAQAASAACVFIASVATAPLVSGQTVEKAKVVIAVSGPPAQIYFLPVVLAKTLGYFF
jgi:hypothetical protein